MGDFFEQKVVFPIIARIIWELYEAKRDWITHDEVEQALLLDEAGLKEIKGARTRKIKKDKGFSLPSQVDLSWWASNMVAWFCQKLSAEGSNLIDLFDHISDDEKCRFKPRKPLDEVNKILSMRLRSPRFRYYQFTMPKD